MGSLSLSSPLGRLAAIGFGLVFGAVALVGIVTGVTDDDLPSLLIGLAMLVAALWIISIGIVGVPVAPGRYVGGGPLLPRIALSPDEPINLQSTASYRVENGRVGKLGGFFYSRQGELFLTDRRLIFIPFRFDLLTPSTVIRYADVRDLRVTSRTSMSTFGSPSFDLLTADGRAHAVWPQSAAAFETLQQLLTIDPFPDTPERQSGEPRYARFAIVSSAATTIGIVAFSIGQRHEPYVHWPEGYRLLLLLGAVVSLGWWAIGSTLKRARSSMTHPRNQQRGQ